MDPFTIAAVAAATAAGSAAIQYQGTRNQAAVGRHQAELRGEQARTQAATAAVQATEQEAERRRRAGLASSSSKAFAALAGIDPASGSFTTLAAENARMVEADVSSIRLMGAAGVRQASMAGRGAELEGSQYATLGSNAWIQPSLAFFGSAARTAQIGGFGGGTPATPKASNDWMNRNSID